MEKYITILVAVVGTMISTTPKAKAMEVAVTIEVLDVSDFAELKCESDSNGEYATGHIKKVGTFSYTWDLGAKNGQDFWIWWDTLEAKANLTVKADGVVIFKGRCDRMSGHECRLTDSSTTAFVKTEGAPRLIADERKPISFIRF